MHATSNLQLLGIPQLQLADGSKIELRQKAFALAALLHLDYHGKARRQAVAERLWETASPPQASTNLRQVLLHTRALEARHGFDLFETDGTCVALRPQVRLDLVDLQAIRLVVDPAELLQLIALYRGGFLEGLTGSADELARWIETERTRIENQFVIDACSAALRLGGAAAQQGMLRLAEVQPFADEVCQVQMLLARASGDEFAVTSIYNEFRTRLWKLLRAEPEPETTALLVPATPALHAAPREAAPLPPAGLQGTRAQVPRIVLLPPRLDAGTTSTPAHLAPGLIEDVTISLCRLRSLVVIAPHSAWQFDPSAAIEEIRAHRIDYAVESRVGLGAGGDALALSVRLIRTAGREIVWADKFRFGVPEAPARYRDLVNGIASSLADRVESTELAAERTTREPTAYSHYLHGRQDLRSFDLPRVRKARKAFRLATDLAPELAVAESALARSYVVEWVLRAGADPDLLDNARAHAGRSISVDPFDGNGYRELGRAALFGGDLDDSLLQFERAERYAPNLADMLADYADTLTHNSDLPGARRRIDAALQLNPLPPDEYWWTLGGIEFFSMRWPEALAALQRMKNQEPALRLMAATRAMSGDREEARQLRQRALALQPDFTIDSWVSRVALRNRADTELYTDALRRAGFR